MALSASAQAEADGDRTCPDVANRKLDEVLVEYRRLGSYVRIAAIDPKTGTEVCIPAPAGRNPEALAPVAIRKLAHVLARRERTTSRSFFA